MMLCSYFACTNYAAVITATADAAVITASGYTAHYRTVYARRHFDSRVAWSISWHQKMMQLMDEDEVDAENLFQLTSV